MISAADQLRMMAESTAAAFWSGISIGLMMAVLMWSRPFLSVSPQEEEYWDKTRHSRRRTFFLTLIVIASSIIAHYAVEWLIILLPH
jgi:hypothetical protein